MCKSDQRREIEAGKMEELFVLNFQQVHFTRPIPVAARSKAWLGDRQLAGIASSIPAEGMLFFSCECCLLSG
jgi:hypothetical protein